MRRGRRARLSLEAILALASFHRNHPKRGAVHFNPSIALRLDADRCQRRLLKFTILRFANRIAPDRQRTALAKRLANGTDVVAQRCVFLRERRDDRIRLADEGKKAWCLDLLRVPDGRWI